MDSTINAHSDPKNASQNGTTKRAANIPHTIPAINPSNIRTGPMDNGFRLRPSPAPTRCAAESPNVSIKIDATAISNENNSDTSVADKKKKNIPRPGNDLMYCGLSNFSKNQEIKGNRVCNVRRTTPPPSKVTTPINIQLKYPK